MILLSVSWIMMSNFKKMFFFSKNIYATKKTHVCRQKTRKMQRKKWLAVQKSLMMIICLFSFLLTSFLTQHVFGLLIIALFLFVMELKLGLLKELKKVVSIFWVIVRKKGFRLSHSCRFCFWYNSPIVVTEGHAM